MEVWSAGLQGSEKKYLERILSLCFLEVYNDW